MGARKKWFIIGGSIIVLAIIVFYIGFKREYLFNENVIGKISKRFGNDLEEFFTPVMRNMLGIHDVIRKRRPDVLSEDSLRQNFYNFFEQHPVYSTAILKIGNTGDFIIYRDKKTYVSSFRINIEPDDSVYLWKRFRQPGKILYQWNEVLSNDLVNEDWYMGSYDLIDNRLIFWEGQYESVFVNETVFAGAIAWETEAMSAHNAIAFEIPVRHLVRVLRKFDWYRQRRIFMTTDDGEFINVPASLKDSLVFYVEESNNQIHEDKILSRVSNDWKLFGSRPNQTFSFLFDDETWWVHIDQAKIDRKTFTYGIALPEDELLLGELRKNKLLLVLTTVFLIAGVIAYFWPLKRKNIKKSTKEITKPAGEKIHTEWKELIKSGENNILEFKSSLRWDLHKNIVNPKLEEVILKTVAAFSNAEGGTLLIGVDDNENIIGLEEDFKSLKKYGPDFFEIHLRNMLNKQFGISFSTNNLDISFLEIEKKIHLCDPDYERYGTIIPDCGRQKRK